MKDVTVWTAGKSEGPDYHATDSGPEQHLGAMRRIGSATLGPPAARSGSGSGVKRGLAAASEGGSGGGGGFGGAVAAQASSVSVGGGFVGINVPYVPIASPALLRVRAFAWLFLLLISLYFNFLCDWVRREGAEGKEGDGSRGISGGPP